MTETTAPRAALVQQHLAAASLLLALPGAELYMTTSRTGVLNIQVPEWHHDQHGLFRRVAAVVRATVLTTDDIANGARHLVATGGSQDGVPVYLYAPLPAEPPTEGDVRDDTTDQGSSGGETAADVRAGADSREVGAVVSEASSAPQEGGVGEPSTDASPDAGDVEQLTHVLDIMSDFPSNEQRARYLLTCNWMRDRGAAAAARVTAMLAELDRRQMADDMRTDARAEADADAQALGYHDDDCRAEIETDAMAEMVAEAAQ